MNWLYLFHHGQTSYSFIWPLIDNTSAITFADCNEFWILCCKTKWLDGAVISNANEQGAARSVNHSNEDVKCCSIQIVCLLSLSFNFFLERGKWKRQEEMKWWQGGKTGKKIGIVNVWLSCLQCWSICASYGTYRLSKVGITYGNLHNFREI